ncbi:MAG TPA: RNA-binding transcriptional accessory protein, partial [Eubacterium sp.]|nr:RNA-binding transcriptional accessory protein [Eubacterium sp.]
YKQKRRTRATIAREKGLEQLAEYIKGQDAKEDVLVEAEKYVSDEEGKEVKSAQEAIAGALDIIAEQISDVADYRTYIRDIT